jgi:WD40-like Beta Propeller Repeat
MSAPPRRALRLALLAAITVLAVTGAGGYVAYAHSRQAALRGSAPGSPVASLAAVTAQPHLVFRSTAPGSGYGQLALAPLSNPDGPRAFTPAACDRAYARRDAAVCLVANRGIATTYRMRTLDAGWHVGTDTPLAGLPSRARLSPDGSLIATTTFVYGDSYTNPGQFSTRTLVGRADGGEPADLEQFALVIDGRAVTAADRNLWGVTFADDDTFYATAATGGRTWLVRGSLSARRLTSIRPDVECPSLSPDGTRIAFKKHGGLPPGQWRLAVYDLATGRETLLAEQRSVDDQVEWLDDGRILYGMPRTAAATATQDVWVVPADGTGAARVFVHDAWSPSVVR